MPLPDYTDEGTALAAAQRSIKAVVGFGTEEEPELLELLYMSAGKLDGEDYFRPAYTAADYLFSDPDRFVKADEGVTFVSLINSVTTLLERQIRLDTTSGAIVSEAWNAASLSEKVLENSAPASQKRRRADLQAI